MKKLIFVLLAAAAFGCGDGSNRSSERQEETNDLNNREELVEPDTTSTQTDTTSINSGSDAGMQRGM